MASAIQGSLFDVEQEFGLASLGSSVRRTTLAGGAWLDLAPGWLGGADALFDRLVRAVPWRAERRMMYDRVVAVPRLLCHYGKDQRLPDPALEQARRALDGYYGPQFGESLCTAGLCLYRDGRDSVAWHGDNSGRRVRETVVAVVSLGNPRHFVLRPRRGSGQALRYLVGHGDLLVMGGTCQRTWEHAVPKTARAVGPRISVQFRPDGIR
ncbi:MAG TPA: alpha-ketoglutarate-dependent dioxygenase AlkB [Streptosporangiaceae bacterium]|nr:alpha-ketoglutarate-dependent dioxygenase AlkB [Streptosporangiaceae bacterium]